MSNKPKISIIIPVYKSEKYIKKCVESALNQSLKDIEVICVNDGSPDSSLNILKEIQKNNDNLVIIDKRNEGVWKARIDGVKKATGEYIGFLDSDDYLDKEFAKKMYESAKEKKSDIVICGFSRIDSDSTKVLSQEMKYPKDRVIELEKNPEEVISINTALWNKIYKSSLLKNLKEINNPPRILEDMMFLSLVYLHTEKISFVEDYLYNYMVIQGSAMNTLKDNDIESIKSAMLEVKAEYNSNNASKEMHEVLASIAFLHLGISLMLSVYKNGKVKFSAEYKSILNYLNINFPMWRKSKYTTIIYNLTHKKYNLKVAIVRKVYVLHLFKAFLGFYDFITKTLKIDIKW